MLRPVQYETIIAKTIAMMATCRVTKTSEGKSKRVMMTAVKGENSGSYRLKLSAGVNHG